MNKTALVQELGSGGSASKQYRQMFVGSLSWWALLRYEFLTGLLGPAPGAVGYLLRSRGYRWLLRQAGRKCLFGRHVTLRSPGNISLGNGVFVDDLAVLDGKGDGGEITLGDQVLIGRAAILTCHSSRIRMGNFVSMGPFCLLASKSFIDIGSNVSIGPGSQILAGSHALDDPSVPPIRQERTSKGITIGDGVWLGAGAIVLDGVTLGANAVIGAGAVVKDDIPANCVAVGMPAKVLYDRTERAAQPSVAGTRQS
jgi:acetyltransferase-like isoleucine patch superfamily enzyme